MISGGLSPIVRLQSRKDEQQREGEDFFYGVYRASNEGVLTKIRRETYGEDLGQFSWITADELRKFFRKLIWTPSRACSMSPVGPADPRFSPRRRSGVRSPASTSTRTGFSRAREMAQVRGLQSRANFEHADASQPLPFPDASFDAVISIDAMNHLSRRAEVLRNGFAFCGPADVFFSPTRLLLPGCSHEMRSLPAAVRWVTSSLLRPVCTNA